MEKLSRRFTRVVWLEMCCRVHTPSRPTRVAGVTSYIRATEAYLLSHKVLLAALEKTFELLLNIFK
jgi:hypothetical protein